MVVNTVQAGKQLTTIWKIEGVTGAFWSTNFLRDGITEIKSLDATFFNGRMMTLGITNELSSGTMKPVRDIIAVSNQSEVYHTFSQLGAYDFSATGAIDNSGDAMAICKPLLGKLVFIKHYSTYQDIYKFVKNTCTCWLFGLRN
jgi:hypothetical protein